MSAGKAAAKRDGSGADPADYRTVAHMYHDAAARLCEKLEKVDPDGVDIVTTAYNCHVMSMALSRFCDDLKACETALAIADGCELARFRRELEEL